MGTGIPSKLYEDRRRILGKEREPPKQTVPSVPQPLEQVPGPSSDVPMNRYNDAPLDIEEEVAKLAQEGGVDFVNYLLAKAIPEADANKSLRPDASFIQSKKSFSWTNGSAVI